MTEIFDGVAFLPSALVIEAVCKATDSKSASLKVGKLTDGARCLLVAFLCFGNLEFVEINGGYDFTKMVLVPMNMIDIRRSVKLMITNLAHYKKIKIGHEATESNVRLWVEELSDNGLIKNDSCPIRFMPGQVASQVK